MEPTPQNAEALPVLLSENIIRVETALSRFPTHRLSKKGDVDINIIEAARDGEVKVRWTVSHSSRHGQPGPLAYKIDTLIVNRRIETADRPVPQLIRLGSLSNICEELGLADSGKNRNNIKEALRQNAFAGVSAKIRYRQQDGSEQTLEADFTRYSVVFTGEVLPAVDGTRKADAKPKKADAVYILLNPIFMNVINGAMTRPLDYAYLKDLSAGSQRFYELLSYQMFAAMKHGRAQARLVYSEFCSYAPQMRYYDSNRVHKQMAKIHAPHRESGYIQEIEFEPTLDSTQQPDWVIHYTPGPRARAEFRAFARRGGPKVVEIEPPSPAPLVVPIEAPEPTPLERELIRRGVAPAAAAELVSAFPGERIAAQIEHFDWLKARHPKRVKDNPGGFLASAIREDYPPRKGFVSRAARDEQAERERSARQAEKAKRETDAALVAAEERRFQTFWEMLAPYQREAFQAEALAQAPPYRMNRYRPLKDKSTPAAAALLNAILKEHFYKTRPEELPAP
ncbi:MAG: hypothetical protein U0835_01010 [Isosphaeraceae bacterium]